MGTTARLFGVMLLCLIAGFIGGWSARTLQGSADVPRSKSIARIDAATASELKSDAIAPSTSSSTHLSDLGAEADAGVIDRTIGGVDPDQEVEWEDESHEVVVWHRPDMSEEDAYVAGVQADRSNPHVEVTVSSEQDPDGTFVVQVLDGDGFCWNQTRLRLDPKTERVEARVRTGGDSYPQPPHDWSDVSGRVDVTSTDWTSGRSIVIDYSIYGLYGGHRACVHGKVSIRL